MLLILAVKASEPANRIVKELAINGSDYLANTGYQQGVIPFSSLCLAYYNLWLFGLNQIDHLDDFSLACHKVGYKPKSKALIVGSDLPPAGPGFYLWS